MATSVILTGIMKHGDATADADRMTFVPTHTMYDAAGLVIVRAGEPTYAAPNTTTGAWSKTLYANDDPTTSPTGTGYAIYQGGTFLGTFVVPYTATLGTVSLASLTPATITANISYASQAALNTEITNRKSALTANFMTISTITAATTYWWMLYVPAAGVLSSAVWMTVSNINVSANNTDYWSFEVYRWRAGSSVIIASKDNKNTGGTAITANTPWVIDPTTFDASNKILAAGDVVAVRMVRNGTPAQSFNNGGALVRWTPDS